MNSASDAPVGGRGLRQRKAKVTYEETNEEDTIMADVESSSASAAAASPAPIEEMQADSHKADIPIENYGMEIEKVLAWRWKEGAVIVHHNKDNSIVTGDTSKNIFEGHENHQHEESVAAASSSVKAKRAPSPALPPPAPIHSSSSRKKKLPAALSDSVDPDSINLSTSTPKTSTKKKKGSDATMNNTPAVVDPAPAGTPVDSSATKSKKRKKAPGASSTPTAASASSTDPSAAPLLIPAPMLGRRRKNFQPVTSDEAMAAFQRSLLAAREAAGISSDTPDTGAYAPRNRPSNKREEDDAPVVDDETDDEAVGETPEPASGEENGDDEEEDEGSVSDDSSAAGGRATKRRRTASKGRKDVKRGRKTKATPKASKAPKSALTTNAYGRPTPTALRNQLIAEHGEKEYFVTFKGRSYLHAKWVDIYAFFQAPDSRLGEAATVASSSEKSTGSYTQLRLKLMRFLAATPVPIGDDEELFLSDFVEIDRILAMKEVPDTEEESTAAASSSTLTSSAPVSKKKSSAASSSKKPRMCTMYLIKWQGLPYSSATWEHSKYVRDDHKIAEFKARQRNPLTISPKEERLRHLGASSAAARPPPEAWNRTKMVYPTQVPTFKNGNELRQWQVAGVNWLNYNWYHKKGCILADEMGLGKTVQVTAHLLHLREVYTRGPFLVIVPLSTLPNWKREFEGWSNLNVVCFQGNRTDRELIKNFEFSFWKNEEKNYDGVTVAMGEEFKFDVLLCTYESILGDATFLAKIPWKIVVVDEAHRLKNSQSRLFQALKLFTFEHRLLMTGTPIQNSLVELWTLLNFIEPQTFASIEKFNSEYGTLMKTDQVRGLQSALSPYLLRRMKEDVAKNIPPKEETIIQVEMTIVQKTYYTAVYKKNRAFLYKGCNAGNVPHLLNIVMQLRKVCSHPFLLPGVEEKLFAEAKASTNEELLRTLVAASGKLVLIDKLLPKLKATGHKVLLFSQMKMVLDLLEWYMKLKGYIYERIDGSIRGNERQAAIDRFCKPDSDRFIFMLSTRAGGQGINLTSADTVIIHDSDFNPQNDLQAEARCHRIGQQKPVKVYRLVTRGTYETDMYKRASMKLGLDQAVLKKSGLEVASLDGESTAGASNSNALSSLSKAEIETLLRNGAYALLDDPGAEAASAAFCEANIDTILADRTTVIKSGGNDADAGPRQMSTFSQVAFASDGADSSLDLNDAQFWQKVIPDESSAHKLTEKMGNGQAYATPAARQEFMTHLAAHVEEIITEYQKGNSLEHVPHILYLLKLIANSKPAEESAPPPQEEQKSSATSSSPSPALNGTTTAGTSSPSITPVPTSASAASSSSPAPTTGTETSPGWTYAQIRQCTEWFNEIEKPRRQRKAADRYTDLTMGVGGLSSGLMIQASTGTESAFKRRLNGKILNGMGGIVFSRKHRRSLTQVILDMAGVLPYPRSVLTAYSGVSAPASGAAASDDTPPVPQVTTEEKFRVWMTFRDKLDPGLHERRLSEIIAWCIAFFGLLISLSDAQDVPIFTAAMERLKACVPSIEDLDAYDAIAAKERRKRDRHAALKRAQVEANRLKAMQAGLRLRRENLKVEQAARLGEIYVPAADPTVEPSLDASAVKSEPSADVAPMDTDDSAVSNVKVEPSDDTAVKVESSLDSSAAAASDPSLATPSLLRGVSTDPSPVEPLVLPDSYDDEQEEEEKAEEEAHYARFHRDVARSTMAHFPSLSEDIPYVKYLVKRCKRWARMMLISVQLALELNEFTTMLDAEAKDTAYITSVVKKYAPDLLTLPPSEREEEETQYIEGGIVLTEDEKLGTGVNTAAAAAASAAAAVTPSLQESALAPTSSFAPDATMTDVAANGAAAAASTLLPSSAAAPPAPLPPLFSPNQRRILSHLNKASITDLKTIPTALLARLLRRTVTRSSPPSELVAQHGPSLGSLRFPPTLERAPIWWWASCDDFDFVIGIMKHGVGFDEIARDAFLVFRYKLARFVFEGGVTALTEKNEDDSEGEDDDKPTASPQKKKKPAAVKAEKQTAAAVKEEDEPMPSSLPSASAQAAGTGCVCQRARYGSSSSKTKVCTSCLYWYHLPCIENVNSLKIDQFLPLPPNHPLAAGFNSTIHHPQASAATESKQLAIDPLSRQISTMTNDDTMEIDAGANAADDSETGSEGEETPVRPRAIKPAASSGAAIDAAGWRCPRCSLAWPVVRTLELRLRVLIDHLARVRTYRQRSREKLLRVLDEANYHASLSSHSSSSAAASTKKYPLTVGNDSAALVVWTKKEKHEFSRALHSWGIAFFTRSGYHAGVPILEALIATTGGKCLATLAHTSNALLARKNVPQLQAYYERFFAQCVYQVEKHRRDTVYDCVRRKNTCILREHRELIEARRLLEEITNGSSVTSSQYCFCHGRASQARMDAAKKARRRRPEEIFLGCDDGSSRECRAAGKWFHGACVGLSAAPETDWVCPFCIAESTSTSVVLPEGADYVPLDPNEYVMPVQPELPALPPPYEPLKLGAFWDGIESSADVSSSSFSSSSAAAVASSSGVQEKKEGESGDDSDTEIAVSNHAQMSLATLQSEYTARIPLYLRDCKAARDEQQVLVGLPPRPLVVPQIVDETITPHLAFKVVTRLKLFHSLKQALLLGEEQITTRLQALAQQKQTSTAASHNANRMPDWWQPPLHDYALMRAIMKHGIGNIDDVLHDPLFLSAWRPEPSVEYPVLTSLLQQSSNAKISVHKEIEKYIMVFLLDRNPLIKRLTLVANWLNYGTIANPNPLDEFNLPTLDASGVTSFPPSSVTLDPVYLALSQYVSPAGKPVEQQTRSAITPRRLPLAALLAAKLASGEASSSENDGTDTSAQPTPVKGKRGRPAGKKKTVDSLDTSMDAEMIPSEGAASSTLADDGLGKGRRTPKRKMHADESIDSPTHRSKSSGKSFTDAEEPLSKRKRRPSAKAAELEDDEDADENGAMSDTEDVKPQKPAAASSSPAAKRQNQHTTNFVTEMDQVPRDENGNVKEFTIKGGIRIVSLGAINGSSQYYHKGTTLFPVGFVSIRPYQSVKNPNTRTEYTNRIVDAADHGAIFSVTAADDPDVVYSGTSASACWTTIVKAVHVAKGIVDGRSAVSGLEHFGISHPIVKKLVHRLPGAQEMLKKLAVLTPLAPIVAGNAPVASLSTPSHALSLQDPASNFKSLQSSAGGSSAAKAAAAVAVATAAAAANAAGAHRGMTAANPHMQAHHMAAGPFGATAVGASPSSYHYPQNATAAANIAYSMGMSQEQFMQMQLMFHHMQQQQQHQHQQQQFGNFAAPTPAMMATPTVAIAQVAPSTPIANNNSSTSEQQETK